MCVPVDARPPVTPVTGAAVSHRRLTLTASDGNEFAAFEAISDDPGPRAGVVILPDVRGLFPFYEELGLRFAEIGIDAAVIDYFGRTAAPPPRGETFTWQDHVPLTTFEGVRADVGAAIEHLRAEDESRSVFTVGFCFGGSNSWSQAANGFGLSGAIGFYGNPVRSGVPLEAPSVVSRVAHIDCPILGLMAGDDPGITPDMVEEFEAALTGAGVTHDIVTYPGAPHSFFDRTYDEHAAASADAWDRVRRFISEYS